MIQFLFTSQNFHCKSTFSVHTSHDLFAKAIPAFDWTVRFNFFDIHMPTLTSFAKLTP